MFGRSKKKPRSLLRRLAYFILLLSGSGAGIGGWALKDHPTVKALLTLVAGDADKVDAGDVEKSLVGDVVGLVKKGPDFTKAGIYQVTINKVELAQAMFKPGHTVDIQAKVTKRDARGQDAVIWESRPYGERLAVVGKDALTFGWPNRPFQVEWGPGEVVFLEVFDRKNGLFASAQAIHVVFLEWRAPIFRSSPAISRSSPSAGPSRRLTPGSTTSCSTASSSASAAIGRKARREWQIPIPIPIAPSSSSKPDRAEGADVMPTRLSFDRFEGKGKQIAVLVTDDGATLNVPKSLLPAGAKPGDVLTLALELDAGATATLAKETRRVQDELSKRDPGGDIKL